MELKKSSTILMPKKNSIDKSINKLKGYGTLLQMYGGASQELEETFNSLKKEYKNTSDDEKKIVIQQQMFNIKDQMQQLLNTVQSTSSYAMQKIMDAGSLLKDKLISSPNIDELYKAKKKQIKMDIEELKKLKKQIQTGGGKRARKQPDIDELTELVSATSIKEKQPDIDELAELVSATSIKEKQPNIDELTNLVSTTSIKEKQPTNLVSTTSIKEKQPELTDLVSAKAPDEKLNKLNDLLSSLKRSGDDMTINVQKRGKLEPKRKKQDINELSDLMSASIKEKQPDIDDLTDLMSATSLKRSGDMTNNVQKRKKQDINELSDLMSATSIKEKQPDIDDLTDLMSATSLKRSKRKKPDMRKTYYTRSKNKEEIEANKRLKELKKLEEKERIANYQRERRKKRSLQRKLKKQNK